MNLASQVESANQNADGSSLVEIGIAADDDNNTNKTIFTTADEQVNQDVASLSVSDAKANESSDKDDSINYQILLNTK